MDVDVLVLVAGVGGQRPDGLARPGVALGDDDVDRPRGQLVGSDRSVHDGAGVVHDRELELRQVGTGRVLDRRRRRRAERELDRRRRLGVVERQRRGPRHTREDVADGQLLGHRELDVAVVREHRRGVGAGEQGRRTGAQHDRDGGRDDGTGDELLLREPALELAEVHRELPFYGGFRPIDQFVAN